MIGKTAAQLISEAKARIENLSPDEVAAEVAQRDPLLVDVREPAERLETGTIPGALPAPRGMLEFYADPTSAFYLGGFDPERRTIVFCASGGRSALAAITLQHLGYQDVAHLDEGLRAWIERGLPIEDASASC
jgi:rhodanese-related sulfurtransferase